MKKLHNSKHKLDRRRNTASAGLSLQSRMRIIFLAVLTLVAASAADAEDLRTETKEAADAVKNETQRTGDKLQRSVSELISILQERGLVASSSPESRLRILRAILHTLDCPAAVKPAGQQRNASSTTKSGLGVVASLRDHYLYMRLNKLSKSAVADLEMLYTQSSPEDLRGLLVDVRNTHGWRGNALPEIADLLLAPRVLVCFLTNGSTSGCVEELVAGLQAHDKVIVMGTKTAGCPPATPAGKLSTGERLFLPVTSPSKNKQTLSVTPDVTFEKDAEQSFTNAGNMAFKDTKSERTQNLPKADMITQAVDLLISLQALSGTTE